MLLQIKITFYVSVVLTFIVALLILVFARKSLLILMLSIELMYFSLVLIFLSWSLDVEAQVFALLTLGVAASDSVIGLSFIYLAYTRKHTIVSMKSYSTLCG